MQKYQLWVMSSQIIFVGIGEKEHLGIWVDSQVRLDDGLVGADEVGQILGLDLRFYAASTVGFTARVAGSSSGWEVNGIHQTYFMEHYMTLFVNVMKDHFLFISNMLLILIALIGSKYSLHHPASKFLLGSVPIQLLPLFLDRVFLHILSCGIKTRAFYFFTLDHIYCTLYIYVSLCVMTIHNVS